MGERSTPDDETRGEGTTDDDETRGDRRSAGPETIGAALEADETLDLRGVECPYTFVHAKLCLEEMEPGETLCIVIDHPPARKSLPASLAYEGHLVLG